MRYPMGLVQRIDIRQSQSLVMTPQLQQAIKLLQLSNVDLATYVEEQLVQNPLLDRDESGHGPDMPGETGAAAESAVSSDAPAPDTASAAEGADIAATAEHVDADYDNVWDAGTGSDGSELMGSTPWGKTGGSFDDDINGLEQTLQQSVSLRDSLTEQLGLEIADPSDRMIGLHLIDMLDDAGYLAGDVAQAARELGCEQADVEAVLAIVQGFEPAGIFARNLAECLALQLRERNRLDPAMQALLDNLDLLAKRDFPSLRRLCGVDSEDLGDMIAEIRTLQPKPAIGFSDEPIQAIVPDLSMRPDPEGGWIVELNSDTLPKVLVNARYYARVRGACTRKTEREYVTEQYNAANWLVKSLHQRATTILKVAAEIVRQQDAFFAQGVRYLRPLTLRDIADAVEMHESTVSRVTTNKHIATPRGLFELKYFFTSAIASSDGGEAHSAEAVRFRIKALIDTEQPSAVLSDDKIVDMLRDDGIDIARRTVAKYREAMHIASSVQRRREKTLQL